jgi:hypothetical protein
MPSGMLAARLFHSWIARSREWPYFVAHTRLWPHVETVISACD